MKAGIRTAYKNWLALVWSLVAAAMLWLPAVASAQTQTLTLPGPSNNQQNVLMFDVHAVNALTVTGLSTAMDSAGTQTYQIYGRTGTHYFLADEAGLQKLQAALKLAPASKGENVAITVPKDLGLLADTIEPAPGAVCTSPIQTYLDLSIAGERGAEAAEHLRQERLSWPK